MKYKSRYQQDPLHFDHNGNYIAGTISDSIKVNRKERDPAEEDRKNRRQVANEIVELVKSGISLEEACNKMVEKYKDKFAYYPEASLAKIFSGWYNGKTREKRPIEERGRY